MTKKWIGPMVIGAMLAFTAVVYTSLPARIPTHWNVSGEVDGWSDRLWGALLAPVMATGGAGGVFLHRIPSRERGTG
jgi:uncharacterized membrane protein